MAGVWICGVLTTFWALFASLVGLFPGLGDGGLLNDSALPEGFSRGTFELVVFIPLIVTLLDRDPVLRARREDPLAGRARAHRAGDDRHGAGRRDRLTATSPERRAGRPAAPAP